MIIRFQYTQVDDFKSYISFNDDWVFVPCFSFLVISVLQQISVDYLEQAITTVDINDEIKGYIYKARAQYLEQIYHVKHIA